LLLAQLKVDPLTAPVTTVIGATTPLQYCWLAMFVTTGVG